MNNEQKNNDMVIYNDIFFYHLKNSINSFCPSFLITKDSANRDLYYDYKTYIQDIIDNRPTFNNALELQTYIQDKVALYTDPSSDINIHTKIFNDFSKTISIFLKESLAKPQAFIQSTHFNKLLYPGLPIYKNYAYNVQTQSDLFTPLKKWLLKKGQNYSFFNDPAYTLNELSVDTIKKTQFIIEKFGFLSIQFENSVTDREAGQWLNNLEKSLINVHNDLHIPYKMAGFNGKLSLIFNPNGLLSMNSTGYLTPDLHFPIISLNNQNTIQSTWIHEYTHLLDLFSGYAYKKDNFNENTDSEMLFSHMIVHNLLNNIPFSQDQKTDHMINYVSQIISGYGYSDFMNIQNEKKQAFHDSSREIFLLTLSNILDEPIDNFKHRVDSMKNEVQYLFDTIAYLTYTNDTEQCFTKIKSFFEHVTKYLKCFSSKSQAAKIDLHSDIFLTFIIEHIHNSATNLGYSAHYSKSIDTIYMNTDFALNALTYSTKYHPHPQNIEEVSKKIYYSKIGELLARTSESIYSVKKESLLHHQDLSFDQKNIIKTNLHYLAEYINDYFQFNLLFENITPQYITNEAGLLKPLEPSFNSKEDTLSLVQQLRTQLRNLEPHLPLEDSHFHENNYPKIQRILKK